MDLGPFSGEHLMYGIGTIFWKTADVWNWDHFLENICCTELGPFSGEQLMYEIGTILWKTADV